MQIGLFERDENIIEVMNYSGLVRSLNAGISLTINERNSKKKTVQLILYTANKMVTDTQTPNNVRIT